jgi:hypothetical protein
MHVFVSARSTPSWCWIAAPVALADLRSYPLLVPCRSPDILHEDQRTPRVEYCHPVRVRLRDVRGRHRAELNR